MKLSDPCIKSSTGARLAVFVRRVIVVPALAKALSGLVCFGLGMLFYTGLNEALRKVIDRCSGVRLLSVHVRSDQDLADSPHHGAAGPKPYTLFLAPKPYKA